jgi:hypothetical protein
MRSTSPRSEQARKENDESSQEKADAARIDKYISLLSSDPRIESVQPNYVYEREDDHSRQIAGAIVSHGDLLGIHQAWPGQAHG